MNALPPSSDGTVGDGVVAGAVGLVAGPGRRRLPGGGGCRGCRVSPDAGRPWQRADQCRADGPAGDVELEATSGGRQAPAHDHPSHAGSRAADPGEPDVAQACAVGEHECQLGVAARVAGEGEPRPDRQWPWAQPPAAAGARAGPVGPQARAGERQASRRDAGRPEGGFAVDRDGISAQRLCARDPQPAVCDTDRRRPGSPLLATTGRGPGDRAHGDEQADRALQQPLGDRAHEDAAGRRRLGREPSARAGNA